MVLFNLRAVPRSSNIIFELICVNEDQWAQKWDENYQREVQKSKKWVHFEDAVNQSKWHQESPWVVEAGVLMLDQVSENWDESKYAKWNIQKSEHFRSLVQSAGQQDRAKENGINARWSSENYSLISTLLLGFFNILLWWSIWWFVIWIWVLGWLRS